MIIKQGEINKNNRSKKKHCDRKELGKHDQETAEKMIQQERNWCEPETPEAYAGTLATSK